MDITGKLAALNLKLPPPAKPVAAYIPAKRVGNLVFVAGQLPTVDGKVTSTGSVPSRCSLEEAKAASRICVLNALSQVGALLGDVNLIQSVVRVGAFVQSDNGFGQQPEVANGASELLVELMGNAGQHVRAAVGTNALPRDASVEIEFIFEVR